MEYMIYIAVGFALGYVLGSVYTALNQARAFKSILQDLGVTNQQLLALKQRIDQDDPDTETTDSPEIEIKLEVHEGTIYAYRKDTSQFLGQGTDRDTLVQSLVERFSRDSGARLIIREEDGAAIMK